MRSTSPPPLSPYLAAAAAQGVGVRAVPEVSSSGYTYGVPTSPFKTYPSPRPGRGVIENIMYGDLSMTYLPIIRLISVYHFSRRAPILCLQLCTGIRSALAFPR
jgi:hypothetical protein